MVQNHDDDINGHVVDNAIILMSLLVTRFHLRRITYPAPIKLAFEKRLTALILKYKDPTT